MSDSRWTLVSDRLPSKDGRYLVQYRLLSRSRVDILYYGRPTYTVRKDKCFYALDGVYGDIPYDDDVIAWMPLPKPYKEEDNEQEADD